MTSEAWWDKFAKTGSVEDYLSYRNERNRADDAQAGEKESESVYHGNGDDTVIHTYR